MPKAKLNPLIMSLSGKMGDVVYKVSKNGKTYVSECPEPSNKEASPAQRERFAQAQAYGKASKELPVYVELGKKKNRSPRRVAASDFFHPPVIHGIERYIDRIEISVTDDVLVQKVYITITNEEGITLEQGSASEVHEGWWKYETEVPGKILVRAWDLAGNMVQGEAREKAYGKET